DCLCGSCHHSQFPESVAQNSYSPKDARFHSSLCNPERFGNLPIGAVFNQRHRDSQLELWGQLSYRAPDFFLRLVLNRGIRSVVCRDLRRQLLLQGPVSQMTQGEIGGNAICPPTKIFLAVKTPTGSIDSPKGFHRQVLCRSRITNNADDPGIYASLKLPEKLFKCIWITLRESLQQAHRLFYIALPRAESAGFIFLW